MPIHKLDQTPTDYATFVDLTCDSDGKIDKFVDLKDVKEVLEIHPFTGEPYYIAILLIGAYQEVMGSFHNLFGMPNEAHVVVGEQGRYHIKKIVNGSRISDMISYARYDKNVAWENFRRLAGARVASGHLLEEDANSIVEQYENGINRYTYLE
jgi:arginine decarboxylase